METRFLGRISMDGHNITSLVDCDSISRDLMKGAELMMLVAPLPL